MGERVSWSVVSFLFLSLLAASAAAESDVTFKLINADPVPAGQMEQMVRISNPARRSACSGTLVGQALITAAHCGQQGDIVTFFLRGRRFTATLNPSPAFRTNRHDISVGVIREPLPSDVKVSSISSLGRAAQGLGITVAGFGCFLRNGARAFDRQLRAGASTILRQNGRDILFGGQSSAILCSGDSGGAAFANENGQDKLLAVNSRGNDNFSIDTRLDTQQSHDFLRQVAQQNGIDICGITKSCDGSPSLSPASPAPQPGSPGGATPAPAAPPPAVAGNNPTSPAPPPSTSPGTAPAAPAPGSSPPPPIAGSVPAPAPTVPIFNPGRQGANPGAHACGPGQFGRQGPFGRQGQVVRVGRIGQGSFDGFGRRPFVQ